MMQRGIILIDFQLKRFDSDDYSNSNVRESQSSTYRRID